MKNYSKLNTEQSTTASAGIVLPHGAAPSLPVNGDVWTTTAGIFVRINGATIGPLVQVTASAPANVTKAAAAVGTSAQAARSDHKHDVTTAAPVANLSPTTTNAEGTATSLARSDHSHAVTWPGATHSTTSCTTTSLTSSANAWEAVTGTVTLPSAGTYRVTADICGGLMASSISAIAAIYARLYNVTASAAISNSQIYIVSSSSTSVYAAGSGSITVYITVAAAATIRIEGLRRTDTGTTYTTSQIQSTTFGTTRLSYERIA